MENTEPKRQAIRVPYSLLARPQVGTTWGYWATPVAGGHRQGLSPLIFFPGVELRCGLCIMLDMIKPITTAVFALIITGSVYAKEGPLWSWSGVDGKVVDVVALDDGSACLLFRQLGLRRFTPGSSQLKPMGLEREDHVAWLGVSRSKTGKNDLVVVGKTHESVLARARRGGKWQQFAEMQHVLENPFCYQSQSGATWLHSWDGALCLFENGKWETHEYAERVKSKGSRTYYQRLSVAEAADGLLCFVANFASKGSGKAMKDILVRQGSEWSTVPLDNKLHPGGACFMDKSALMIVTEKGLFEIDPLAQREPKQVAGLPGAPEIFQRPIFMTKLADGKLITIWTKRQSGWSGAPTYEDGSFSRIAEYDGNEWKVVDVVADKAGWDSYNMARPSVEDSAGTFWLGVAGGGVMFRTQEGKWGRLGWREGVSGTKPIQLVAAPDERLWIVDKSGACQLLDTKQEPVSEKAETPWSKLAIRSELREGPDGMLYGVSDLNGGSILKLSRQGPELKPLPPALRLRTEHLYYMSFDSEGGMWLFSNALSGQRKTAHFDGKEWHMHTPGSIKEGLNYHDKEVAFQTQLGQAKGYRIGRPEDQYYVQYTSDNRILYQNEWRRACYFDGKQWHAPYGANEVADSTLSDHPFFHEGKVTIHVSGKCYQMENDAWAQAVDDRSQRAWKEVAMIPHPFSQRKGREQKGVDAIPANCPIAKSERLWKRRSDPWVWVGGATEIACSSGHGWVSIPTDRSPLAGPARVRKVLSSASGQWLFLQEGGRPCKYAVYQTKALDVEAGPAELGKVDYPFAAVEFPWTTDRSDDDLLQRVRIDGGEWVGIPPAKTIEIGLVPEKGMHEIEVELTGKRDLSQGPILKYAFDVTYDAQTMIRDLILELGAPSSAKREQATQTLIRLGKSATRQVTEAMVTDDPEVRMRLKRILGALEDGRTG